MTPVFLSTNKTNTSISVVVYVADRETARMRGQFAGMDARLELGQEVVNERSSSAVKSQQVTTGQASPAASVVQRSECLHMAREVGGSRLTAAVVVPLRSDSVSRS